MSRLIHLRQLRDLTGLCHSSVYRDLKLGLLPPPVEWGRSKVWLKSEIERVMEARIAGCTDKQVQGLVQRIVARRPKPELVANG